MKEHLRRLVTGTAIYGLGSILAKFASFLLLPLFTAYLTPADYGVISLLAMLSFFLTPVFTLGLGTSIGVCYFDRAGENKGFTVWTSFVILAGSAAVLAVVGTILADRISLLLTGDARHARLIVLTTLSTCAGMLAMPFTLRLQLEEKAKLFVTLSLVATCVSLGSAVVMVVVFKGGARGFVEAGLFSQVVSMLMFAATACRLRFGVSASTGRELLRHGVPMIPSFASLFVLQQGNRYALQYFRGIEPVGIYTVGYNIGMGMNILVNAFSAAWTPYFLSFAQRREEARENFGRVATYYVLGFGTASLLFHVFARPVVLLMTQPPFHEAYKAVGPSATAAFLNGAFCLLLPAVYFAREVKYVAAVQAAAAILAVGINLALVPAFGVPGAAWSLTLGMLAMTVLMHAWNRWRRDVYLDVSFERDRLGPFCVVYVLVAVLAGLDRSIPVAAEVTLSAAAAVAVLLAAIRLLSDTERKALRTYLYSLRPGV